ncbi:SpoIIE family protein phosphatase [candidate division KSB1 bacterium]|nr:SpoIIE family protein phosphatase [candidate division KSB1 bacterium]
MNLDKRFLAILLALFGCLLIALYFWISSHSKPTQLLHQHVPKGEILAKAEDAYYKSPFVDYNLQQDVDLSIDDDLMHYAQLHLKDTDKFLPIGRWEISWTGEIQTKKEGAQEVKFSVSYDFRGNLIELEQNSPELNNPPNFKESEAILEAKRYLYSFDIDTATISLRNKIINKEDLTLKYDFLFTKRSSVSPDLIEDYHITISGRNITSYRARTIIDRDRYNFPESGHDFEVAGIITSMSVWFLTGIFLTVLLLKRLKHDLLEFKRGLWVGVVVLVLMWLRIALEDWAEWQAVLIGGGFAGVFSGLGFVLSYSVTESLNREVWQERLVLTDVLFRGTFRVKEFGAAILNALFISGVSVFFFAALLLLISNIGFGCYLTFDEDVLWIFKDEPALLANICESLSSSLFIGVMIFSFWPVYLRSKIRNKALLVGIVALLINLAGLDLYYFRPTHLAFFLLLPLAAFWAYAALKFDIISIFLAVFVTSFFLELPLINLLPDGFWGTPGLIAFSVVFVMLASGSYCVYSKTSAQDFKDYVPDYVSRIAERERFLKELEIARSVQMRFLPQSIPTFPNLEIACICRPAMDVGGDYYDFICDGSHSIGVILGDVSGKGVSAAFYMTMVKGIVKTLTKTTKTPKTILTEMNTIFYENAPRDTFISMVYGLFDMQNRMLTFARAGHNPIIVRKGTRNRPEMLNAKGLAIGLDRGDVFSTTIEELSLPVEPGDVFVFFTDGITESMNKGGEEFGEDKLRETINQNANQSAQELLEKITLEVNNFSGAGPQHDDFTMVVVKVCG